MCLSIKSIPDSWYSPRNIKVGLEISYFGILSHLMTKSSVLPHSSVSTEKTFSFVNQIKTNSLKHTLFRKACWQNKHCWGCRKTNTNGSVCLSHLCRVRIINPSSQSYPNFFRVDSWLGRLESQELSSHFESLVCKLESMSSHMKFDIFLWHVLYYEIFMLSFIFLCYDSTLTRKNFRWPWLDFDSKALWLWLDKNDLGTSLLLAWASTEIFPGGATSTFCWSLSGCWWCNANVRSRNVLPILNDNTKR